MKHHNLPNFTKAMLFNSLSVQDFGVYTDSVSGNDILLFKKKGLQVPFYGAHGSPTVSKVCSDDGAVRVLGVILDDVCPCEECRTNYGIQINKYPKHPGVFNSQVDRSLKGYGGVIEKSLDCVSGVIPAALMTEMIDDIINQVNADIGFSNQDSGSGAHAGYMYLVTTTDAWAADNIAVNGGTATGVQASRAAMITALNALTDVYAFEGPTATTMWILANDAPTTAITLTTSTNVTLGAQLYLGLMATDVDTPIDVTFSEEVDVVGTVTVAQAGYFASLTPEEVFAQFTNMGHHGSLTANIYRDLPIKDAHYCKYHFEFNDTVDALNSGAGHLEHYEGAFDLFIKEDLVDDLIWDGSLGAGTWMLESTADNAAFVPDSDFEDLITTGWGATIV